MLVEYKHSPSSNFTRISEIVQTVILDLKMSLDKILCLFKILVELGH